jgi:hypothetical protein
VLFRAKLVRLKREREAGAVAWRSREDGGLEERAADLRRPVLQILRARFFAGALQVAVRSL